MIDAATLFMNVTVVLFILAAGLLVWYRLHHVWVLTVMVLAVVMVLVANLLRYLRMEEP